MTIDSISRDNKILVGDHEFVFNNLTMGVRHKDTILNCKDNVTSLVLHGVPIYSIKGKHVLLTVIDGSSSNVFVGLSWYTHLNLIDYILYRDQEKIAKFPKFFDAQKCWAVDNCTVLVFSGYSDIKVDLYDETPDLFVGFDKEIKREAYELVIKSKEIECSFKPSIFEQMNKIPIR